ncbi:MAG: hypothetical protein UU16_C0023G0001 [Candidatus Woesebacteria bacterium GW2011_GWA2_40_7]|uniref:Uncharacterized protein n=3 Tax=Candidatus Woeseibacteriota TaxID=1752722 RepID=A0A0G0UUC0_9BACT|nr:MAG: hypothetical protein UT17_C0001G0112 [Candidatus Woesebacteria bacterium GW2011_GWB1_39_10]KKR73336.1 MAG: hypothetical protein UU16_C0023G0001 [Candidatus Woesebacteria bacterium GW2011_GWA2_40_7]KKR92298.1 MAG: hypothetical protein UU42_C0002G0112 [Candidatus Woesebacteria bacterium GW2011_GWA1_41_13b]
MDPNATNPIVPAADPNAPVQAPVMPGTDQPVGTPAPVEPVMPVEPAMPEPEAPAMPTPAPTEGTGDATGGMPPVVPPATV